MSLNLCGFLYFLSLLFSYLQLAPQLRHISHLLLFSPMPGETTLGLRQGPLQCREGASKCILDSLEALWGILAYRHSTELAIFMLVCSFQWKLSEGCDLEPAPSHSLWWWAECIRPPTAEALEGYHQLGFWVSTFSRPPQGNRISRMKHRSRLYRPMSESRFTNDTQVPLQRLKHQQHAYMNHDITCKMTRISSYSPIQGVNFRNDNNFVSLPKMYFRR